MTSYAKGVRTERLARRQLEATGNLVIRSAGSKGPFDLVALGSNGVRFIQVRDDDVSNPAKDIMREEHAHLPRLPGVSYELWERRNRTWVWQGPV